jgi:gluconolactonase
VSVQHATSTSGSDARLDDLIERAAAPECIASGFIFVEGPAWHAGLRSLVFSDIIGDTLYGWNGPNNVVVLRRPSHMANGNAWDHEGRLLTCEHATSRVSRTHADGRYEVLASHYTGRELNSPNDIVVRRDGSIYFTDPNSGRTARYGVEREQQLPFQGVFRLDASTGELVLLVDDFSKPNGLCFSLDEKRLFVNDTDRQHIRAFDVQPDGTIAGGEVWAETGGTEPGVADGMKFDSRGNLYCCGSGGIHVFDPDAGRIGIIRTPEVAANLNWGGATLTDLFITARTSVYRLKMRVPGHDPFMCAGRAG